MGGYSSNRWRFEHIREETDPLMSLDVRRLNRDGALRPGAVSTTSWTCRGEASGMIMTIMDHVRPCLTLEYRIRMGNEPWRPIHEPVWLLTTECHFGGNRVWFACPGCSNRCAVLYSLDGRFRCRICHDLAYSSTREDGLERSIRRLSVLRKRMGGDWSASPWTIPAKPEDMSWRTYNRLSRKLIEEINRNSRIFADDLSRMASRIGCLDED